MLKYILLIAVGGFFAINMGGSGIAPAFAAPLGARLIGKKKALLFFEVFVILGAVCFGKNVALTLGKGLLPKEFITFDAALIILLAATLSLFLANMLKIPQSTSQVTVGAVVGAGLYFKHLYLKTLFFKILPMWVILPILSYVMTFLLYNRIYPPHRDNLHIYEKLFAHGKKLKLALLIMSCYVAFAIGTNNVANAVGPLYGAGILGISSGLIFIAPLFGLGAWFLGKGTLETAGGEIVPLGLFSSTLISFVTATLLIFASVLGVPQSLVQLNLCSIFAVSSVKNGHGHTLDHRITKKTFMVWTLTPLLAVGVAYGLLTLFLKRPPC